MNDLTKFVFSDEYEAQKRRILGVPGNAVV